PGGGQLDRFPPGRPEGSQMVAAQRLAAAKHETPPARRPTGDEPSHEVASGDDTDRATVRVDDRNAAQPLVHHRPPRRLDRVDDADADDVASHDLLDMCHRCPFFASCLRPARTHQIRRPFSTSSRARLRRRHINISPNPATTTALSSVVRNAPGGIETSMTASRPVWSRTITYRSDHAGFASRQSCFTALSLLASSERREEVKPLSKSGRSALR